MQTRTAHPDGALIALEGGATVRQTAASILWVLRPGQVKLQQSPFLVSPDAPFRLPTPTADAVMRIPAPTIIERPHSTLSGHSPCVEIETHAMLDYRLALVRFPGSPYFAYVPLSQNCVYGKSLDRAAGSD
jgi:hypothetical protein